MYQESDISNLLHESIVEGLEALGKDMGEVILYHISQLKGISKEQVAQRAEVFESGLKEIFGEGSAVLERLVLAKLNSKLGTVHVVESVWSLRDYVEICRSLEAPAKGKAELVLEEGE